MSNIEILKSRDKNEAIIKAAEILSKSIEDNIQYPILFLVSGGSALSILDKINDENLNKNITIGVLDERASENPTENNFQLLKSTDFFRRALSKGVAFLDSTFLASDSLDSLANRFNLNIKKWLNNNPMGRVIITQGIGDDCHTAGIFPHEDGTFFNYMFQSEAITQGYDVTGQNPYPLRVTVTGSFLISEVGVSIVFVVGENKKEALRNALTSSARNLHPASIIQDMKKVYLITDCEL